MSSVIEMLERLEAAVGEGSRTEKEDILCINRNNALLKKVFWSALDPFIVYYVAKFKTPKPVIKTGNSSYDDTLRNFIDNVLTKCATREVTGNAAKQLVIDAFQEMDVLEQKWCQRILLKNLRCGVQTLIDDVWPDLIPKFVVQLAEKVKCDFIPGVGIVIKGNINYPIHVEPKLDGHRCVAIKHLGVTKLYSRNGQLTETLPKILAFLQQNMTDETILDGEAMGRDWNETSSVIGSTKNPKDDSYMKYHVWDMMSFSDWVKNVNSIPTSQRVVDVAKELAYTEKGPILQVMGKTVNNEEELLEFYRECLELGYEGIMLKKLDAPYIFDRSHAVEKLKPVVTYEGMIIGHYLGRRGTQNEGKFGGFRVVLPNGIVTRVGNGYKKNDRADIQLAGADSYIARIIELEAQPDPATTDGLTVDGKARFPVYIRYRSERDVDPKVVIAGTKHLAEKGTWNTLDEETDDE